MDNKYYFFKHNKVRETALNGARAVRSKIDGYRHFFEERDTYLLGTVTSIAL